MGFGTSRQNKKKVDSDNELNAMMTELNNLEKGLSFEEVSIRAQAKIEKSLQEQIDEELALALMESSKMTGDAATEIKVTAEITEGFVDEQESMENLLAFETPDELPSLTDSQDTLVEMKSKGHLYMALQMNLGDSSANVTLDSSLGIEINIQDMKLSIDPENGCIIELKNGMNFTIPLSVSDLEIKKKVS